MIEDVEYGFINALHRNSFYSFDNKYYKWF